MRLDLRLPLANKAPKATVCLLFTRQRQETFHRHSRMSACGHRARPHLSNEPRERTQPLPIHTPAPHLLAFTDVAQLGASFSGLCPQTAMEIRIVFPLPLALSLGCLLYQSLAIICANILPISRKKLPSLLWPIFVNSAAGFRSDTENCLAQTYLRLENYNCYCFSSCLTEDNELLQCI